MLSPKTKYLVAWGSTLTPNPAYPTDPNPALNRYF